ncbi:hypothetical protein QQF64_006804 [Cirrhinus molitorella]|uniref:Uncharacterized protein n=1 Tax=Cirrhinus molitorella TaxID=172907 RepID=A0ABR3MC46_9TELE
MSRHVTQTAASWDSSSILKELKEVICASDTFAYLKHEFCPLPGILSARRSWQGLKALASPPQRSIISLRVIWYQAFPFGTNLLARVSDLDARWPKRPLKLPQNIQ